jgi:hypothetical protein
VDDPQASDPANWTGENLLGLSLMNVRQKLSSRYGDPELRRTTGIRQGPLSDDNLLYEQRRTHAIEDGRLLMRPRRLVPFGVAQYKSGETLPDDDEMFFKKAIELDLPCRFVSKNPKQKNSKSFHRWEDYCKAKTLKEAIELNAPEFAIKDLKFAYARGQITFPGYEFSEANVAEQEHMAFPFFNDIIRDFYPIDELPAFLKSDQDTLKFAMEQTRRIQEIHSDTDMANIVRLQQKQRKIHGKDIPMKKKKGSLREVDEKLQKTYAFMFEASNQLPDVTDYVKPSFWRSAVSRDDPLREFWIKAMKEEYQKLWDMGTFEYVTIDKAKEDPKYHKPFPFTHDLKIKRDRDNKPYEMKSRMCLRGDLAYDGISTAQVYSPTCSYQGIRSIIALAAYRSLELKQLDISSAFLNSLVPEGQSLYCQQPPGPAFDIKYDELGRPLLLRCNRFIYGHSMAPAAWFKTLAAHLENDFDMRPLISEPCIFSKTKKIDGKDETIWCACFVDDVLYTSTSPVLEREFYKTLSSRFKIKESESGLASWILGMAVDCERDSEKQVQSYKISSKAHIEKLVDFIGIGEHDLANTPLDATVRLPKLDTPEEGIDPNTCVGTNKRSMLSAIGSILFIALTTRPEICYACSMIARHAKNPGKSHIQQLLRIIHYLNATKDLGITYRRKGLIPNQPMASAYHSGIHPMDVDKIDPLRVYADSAFMDNYDRKSTSGWFICFAQSPLLWSSKLSTITPQSTAEAEVLSACDAAKSVIHTKLLIEELGFADEAKKPTQIMEDNSSCVAFSENLKSRRTTRHFELRVHFLQELVRSEQVKFVQCPTKMMIGDLLTKALPHDQFENLRDQLLGIKPHQALLELPSVTGVPQQGGGEKLVDQNHAESQRAHVQSNTVHDQLAEDGLSNADLLVSIRKKSNREVKGKVTLGTHTAKSHICEEVLPIAAVIIRDAIRLYSNNQAPVISPMITTTRFSQLH